MNMYTVYKHILVIFSVAFLISCHKKNKPSLAGEDPVDIKDFIGSFQNVKLPYQFKDADLLKRDDDSLRISYRVFTQFVPDSVISKIFGKGARPRFFPMAKIAVPQQETYLFVKAVSGEKTIALIAGFNRKQQFIAAMPVLQPDQVASTQQISGIDKKLSIFEIIQRKNADGSVSEGKEVYILNGEGGNFMLILTDALDKQPAELINPIENMPRKNKLSADYVAGKMNLVSVRDGRKPDRINFFIHFIHESLYREKDNGECIGELKGEAILKSPLFAEYRKNGDPCLLQLRFTQSSVSIKEVEGCGSHRGPYCVFEGTFLRKKESKRKRR
jgi:hypothetical protein